MVVAQNHARIYNVVVEVNLCGFQRQSAIVRITVEPTLIQAVPNGLAVVVRVADVEHHRRVLPEELLQYACDNPKHIVILRGVGITIVGDKEMICAVS